MEKTAHITFTLREADGIFAADVETSTPQGIRHTTLYGNSADPFASYLKLYLDSMDSMQQFLEESSATFHLPLTPADFDIGFDRRATATRQMLQKRSADGNGGFPTPDDSPRNCVSLVRSSCRFCSPVPPLPFLFFLLSGRKMPC